ncbi:MAG: cell wall hydrolase, partial [Waterburya sp.]
ENQRELYLLSTKKPLQVNPELECLVEALWFEARSESELGILAVASVVHNRKLSGYWGSTYCRVIQSPMQFSYRNSLVPGAMVKIPVTVRQSKRFKEIETIAGRVYNYQHVILNNSVKWYTTTDISKPSWTKNLKKEVTIDRHVFYRE